MFHFGLDLGMCRPMKTVARTEIHPHVFMLVFLLYLLLLRIPSIDLEVLDTGSWSALELQVGGTGQTTKTRLKLKKHLEREK